MRLLNSYLKYIIACVFVLLIYSKSYSQTDFFKLENNKRAVVIPFQFVNKNIVIPLSINDSDSLYFILDTGLRQTLITQLFPEDSLHLNNTREEYIRGLGRGKPLKVLVSLDNKITLDGIEGFHQRINFLTEDIFSLSQLGGTKINGIIGYDFLKNFIIKIDYIKHNITLYNPEKYRKKLRKYKFYPLDIISGKPYIHANIIDAGYNELKLKLLVDTGASLSLWLMDNNTIKITRPDTTLYTYIGQGLNGRINGDIGRIPKLYLHNKALTNVTTAFPDQQDIKNAFSEGRNGTIGGEVLRRFYIVIDYPNKKLWLKPNKNFKKPFTFNQSGIEIYQPTLNIPFYYIFSVRNDSPAKNAGLKENDLLVKINEKHVINKSLQELINTFEKIEVSKKREFNLVINRNDSLININFKLPKKSL